MRAPESRASRIHAGTRILGITPQHRRRTAQQHIESTTTVLQVVIVLGPFAPEGWTLTGVGGWEKESFEVDGANIETMKAAPSMKSRHRDWQIVHSMTQPIVLLPAVGFVCT